EELRGAGDREAVGHAAGEEEVEVVGEEEAARGEIVDGGAARDGVGEVERAVVGDGGEAGGGVDAGDGGAGGGEFLETWLRAGVAVGVNWIHETAGVVNERVVDAPGVDADGRDGFELRGGVAEAGLDFGPERGDVPVIVAGEGVEGVGKAVDL